MANPSFKDPAWQKAQSLKSHLVPRKPRGPKFTPLSEDELGLNRAIQQAMGKRVTRSLSQDYRDGFRDAVHWMLKWGQ